MNKYFIIALQSLLILAVQPSFWSEYGKSYTPSGHHGFLGPREEYTVQYFDQVVDHNTFSSPATFKQKFLVRSQYWNPKTGPIFFYCGNEGPVEMFYENSGFLNNDLAQRFQALVIYVEHRYFGVSQPFGDQKTSYLKENLVYLTSEQALQDFAYFLQHFKRDNNINSKVVAFGGSYGGMLASWFRMKYPNVIDGAVAMSAPIYYFANRANLDINVFFKISTQDFTHSSIGETCPRVIREVYRRIESYKQNGINYDALNKGFKLCTPITNSTGVLGLEKYLNDGLTYMAMTNYPYETKFLKKLPGWPATTACEQIKGASVEMADEEIFDYVRKGIEVYYNYEQTQKCNEVQGPDQSADADMSGWNILACADMVMPMGSDGVNDMFNPQPWDYEAYTKMCQQTYGLTPNYNYTLEHFGGVVDSEMLGYSNIFFSNGKLDPWSGASPLETLSSTLQAVYMDDSSHHLDLRSPHPLDPVSVNEGRQLEIKFLQQILSTVVSE